jgi:hypothetical protein
MALYDPSGVIGLSPSEGRPAASSSKMCHDAPREPTREGG